MTSRKKRRPRSGSAPKPPAGGSMLIDAFVADFDAVERHRITIDAPRSDVYAAVWAADFAKLRVLRALTALRALPARLLGKTPGGGEPRQAPRVLDLCAMMDAGFGMLAEQRDSEVVLGVTGRFWRPTGNLLPFRREDFDAPVAPGTARAVWNFVVQDAPDGKTVLSTETRVICGDAASRAKFRAYWLLVRPFSGWIRIVMLREIARTCARATE